MPAEEHEEMQHYLSNFFCGEEIIPWLDNYWKSNIEPLAGEIGDSEHSDRKQYPADPGMVLFEKQPDEIHYWNAVRGEVSYIEGEFNGVDTEELEQQLHVLGEQLKQRGKELLGPMKKDMLVMNYLLK